MSYSHAEDSRLAPALQRGLERLTRAWYQRQALRIFRDQTNLSATADLSATIERALRNSRHFLLLASPGAAQSPWVRREIRFWKANRGREKLLIALTDGVIKWDDEAGDFDWEVTNALPEEELRGWFASEPLWVNLGWTRDRKPSDLTLRHGRFRGDVATLAASLHGRSKEQIDSEDARQHRRAVWIGRAVVAVLAVLLVLSGVETNSANTQRGIAQQQRNVAQQQRNVAQQQRTVAQQQRTVAQQQRALATQRALEALAQVDAATAPATSLDMSLAALRIDPTAQVRQTLVNTLLHTGYEGSSQLPIPSYSILQAAFSPDGRLFAAAWEESGKTMIGLWNTANPAHPSRLPSISGIPANADISGMVFSPGDRLLAVVIGGTVELWSPTGTPRLLSSFTVSAAPALSAQQVVAFSPDGMTLAAASGQSTNGTLETWTVANPDAPQLLARFGGVPEPDAVTFSPDGRTLLVGTTGANPGTLVTANSTYTVVWDVSDLRSPRQLTTIPQWDGDNGFAFSPDGKILISTWSDEASLWDFADPARPRQLSVLRGNVGGIGMFAFSPDGRTLATTATTGVNYKMLLWNIANPAQVPQPTLLAETTTPIEALALAPGGQSVVAVDDTGQVSQWHVTSDAPTLAATLTDSADPSAAALAVAVSPDSRVLATTGDDDAVILWNVTNPTRPVRLARFATGAGPGSALAFSPDGTVLAVGGWNHRLTLWDVRDPASPRLLATVPAPGGATNWLAFTSDGSTLIGGGEGLVDGIPQSYVLAWTTMWNISDPRDPVVLYRFPVVGAGNAGSLSPDGKILVLAKFHGGGGLGQGTVEVWNISSPAHPVQLPGPNDADVKQVAAPSVSTLNSQLTFAPIGGLAATTSDENPPKVVLWSYNGHSAATQISAVTGPSDQITSLSFDPTGNLLAAASDDFTTTVWDVADHTQPFTVQTITGDTAAVNDAVFSPDDHLLVSASSDGAAQVWTLGALPAIAANPVGLACRLTGGGFTRSQWAQYVPGIPYAASCP